MVPGQWENRDDGASLALTNRVKGSFHRDAGKPSDYEGPKWTCFALGKHLGRCETEAEAKLVIEKALAAEVKRINDAWNNFLASQGLPQSS